MKKPIVTDINFLKQKSLPIETLDEAKEILQDLEDSLDTKKGVGLAAPQIGILKQISLIKLGDKKIVLMNPEIIEKNQPIRINGEGCLSIQNKKGGGVHRAGISQMDWQDKIPFKRRSC